MTEEVTDTVGVTLGVEEADGEPEGVAPNDRDPVGVNEIVGVIEGVPENDAPNDIVGVVEGVPDGVLVAELEPVGDGLGVGAATKVKPTEENV